MVAFRNETWQPLATAIAAAGSVAAASVSAAMGFKWLGNIEQGLQNVRAEVDQLRADLVQTEARLVERLVEAQRASMEAQRASEERLMGAIAGVKEHSALDARLIALEERMSKS
eukprot:TRINITY_DN5523_c0_g1_i4.p3 TRINITY_DN5523_c0_g1~~TRINITY_DN5523_c0_g1_i4.p3  ORF type:complete len:114 (-),score=22.97 TRINITY_DN5523_c0_g1_i4:376-717(-)